MSARLLLVLLVALLAVPARAGERRPGQRRPAHGPGLLADRGADLRTRPDELNKTVAEAKQAAIRSASRVIPVHRRPRHRGSLWATRRPTRSSSGTSSPSSTRIACWSRCRRVSASTTRASRWQGAARAEGAQPGKTPDRADRVRGRSGAALAAANGVELPVQAKSTATARPPDHRVLRAADPR